MKIPPYSQKHPVLSSGSLQLDLNLINSGLMPGELVLIHGPQECGKTLLCLNMLIEAGKAGKNSILIDADHGLEPDFAIQYGADPDRIFLCQAIEPGNILQFTETILQERVYSIVVIDSVTDFMDETVQGYEQHQLELSGYLPRLIALAKKSGAVLVFTEHTNIWERRVYHQLAQHLEKISLALHAAVRVNLEPAREMSGVETSGLRVKITLLKGNKSTAIFPINLNLLYNHNTVKCTEILDLGLLTGLIKIQNNTFTFGNLLLGSDFQKSLLFLEKNPAATEKIEHDIRNRFVL